MCYVGYSRQPFVFIDEHDDVCSPSCPVAGQRTRTTAPDQQPGAGVQTLSKAGP